MWMSDGRDCAGDLRQSLRGGTEDERDAVILVMSWMEMKSR